jgi:hypothetical protein
MYARLSVAVCKPTMATEMHNQSHSCSSFVTSIIIIVLSHTPGWPLSSVACMADWTVTICQLPVIVCGTLQGQYATCNVYPTQLPTLYVGP